MRFQHPSYKCSRNTKYIDAAKNWTSYKLVCKKNYRTETTTIWWVMHVQKTVGILKSMFLSEIHGRKGAAQALPKKGWGSCWSSQVPFRPHYLNYLCGFVWNYVIGIAVIGVFPSISTRVILLWFVERFMLIMTCPSILEMAKMIHNASSKT